MMDPQEHWKVLTAVIAAGGHVRVGMEDNPFLRPGDYARTNAELVEKITRIAREQPGDRRRKRARSSAYSTRR